MEASLRHRLGPIAGIVTLGIGLGFIAVVHLFTVPRVDNPKAWEILIARPGENPSLTLPSKLELSCYDPQILPVWKGLKSDEQFKVRIAGLTGIFDCAGMLDVAHIDLNNDGRPEVLARGKDDFLCGHGRSSCGLWVFSNSDDKYRVLLSSSDFGDTDSLDDLLRKSRTRGYSDLVLKNFAGEDETIYSTYIYNGRDYVESRCVYEVPKENARSEGSYEVVACRDYERRVVSR